MSNAYEIVAAFKLQIAKHLSACPRFCSTWIAVDMPITLVYGQVMAGGIEYNGACSPNPDRCGEPEISPAGRL
jgi:hypothetical protein